MTDKPKRLEPDIINNTFMRGEDKPFPTPQEFSQYVDYDYFCEAYTACYQALQEAENSPKKTVCPKCNTTIFELPQKANSEEIRNSYEGAWKRVSALQQQLDEANRRIVAMKKDYDIAITAIDTKQQQLEEYKTEWESCCERERATWTQCKELQQQLEAKDAFFLKEKIDIQQVKNQRIAELQQQLEAKDKMLAKDMGFFAAKDELINKQEKRITEFELRDKPEEE